MSIPTIESYQTQLATSTNKLEGGLRTRGQCFKTGSKDNPLVSIITIVRNGEATLERTIKSVLAQSYAPIEYIIIDGGSTDKTLSIIAGYENELAYWRSEPDKGISDAFNKGIALATGDIIGIINADDWYELDAVMNAVRSLLDNNAGVLHGALQYWNSNSLGILMGANHAQLHRKMTISHPTVFVKREVYLRHGLFLLDFNYAMDYEWILRVKTADVVFFYIDKALANMQQGGVGDKNWKLGFQEVMRAKENNLGHSYQHSLLTLFFITKSFLRRSADAIGLRILTRIYNKYFGLAKNA